MIVGIDPSYSSTGIVVTSDDSKEVYFHEKYSSSISVYDGHSYADGAFKIVNHIFDSLLSLYEKHKEPLHIICEIPALSTKSGAYLAVLHGQLDYMFRTMALPVVDYVWVPCMACNSYTKNKNNSKTYLVRWVQDRWDLPKRFSHDESTALIFCSLYCSIKRKEYKNSYYSYTL